MANENIVMYRSSGGGGALMNGYPPENPTNLSAEAKYQSVELTWEDPDDLPITEGLTVRWSFTRIIRKVESYPQNENDGTIVVESSVRNQYKDNPFVDTNLTNHTTYYYAAFSCSEDGIYNKELVRAEATPVGYRTMTVVINESDSNPATCCSYADDAIGMESGKDATEWADFFGYKPCLFKDGQVVGYLNPNDYTKFENGDPADITSGDAGDVMVEFPRRGVKISKVENTIIVSMTDEPDNSDFTYYAHTRGSTRKDYFYLGAYLGWGSNNLFRSLSDKYPDKNTSLDVVRTMAHKRGSGYEIFTFYQWTYIQVMYILQFKSLDSQTAVGKGYVSNYSSSNTGSTNTNGMIYGATSSATHVKLFGIEDIWGNLEQYVDGFFVDNSYNYMTATDNFNNNRTGYTNNGSWRSTSSFAYITKVTGTSETGFVISSSGGSSSTYYCDYCYMQTFSFLTVGGNWEDGLEAGIFGTSGNGATSPSSTTGSRLSYY